MISASTSSAPLEPSRSEPPQVAAASASAAPRPSRIGPVIAGSLTVLAATAVCVDRWRRSARHERGVRAIALWALGASALASLLSWKRGPRAVTLEYDYAQDGEPLFV